MWVGFTQSAEGQIEQGLIFPTQEGDSNWNSSLSLQPAGLLHQILDSLDNRVDQSQTEYVAWPGSLGHVLWSQEGQVLNLAPPFTVCMILNN